MDFTHSDRAVRLTDQVRQFVREEIEPRDEEHAAALRESPWAVPPVVDELKKKARDAGLWNLFLPDPELGAGLSNVEYAPMAEAMGSSGWAPEVFNCNAPDTGNAEVLLHYGSAEQRQQWLRPLLDGTIRSAFCMTEPEVASSDATNMAATAVVDGEEIVLNGRKWWSTGVGHPNCKFVIFMGLTDPEAHPYQRHSMVLVPLDTPGVRVERMLTTFGYLDEPFGHGEVTFTDVRLPLDAVIAGPGRGFEIAQGRLGPGRIHHCMRAIGLAERALELACRRALSRTAFGKPLANLGGNRERIANARVAIDQARLLVLHTAWLLDTKGLAGARSEVSQIKAVVPRMTQEVLDMAMQLHGGAGLSDDFPLARAFAGIRSLRFADGPDEVHLGVIARQELRKYGNDR
ncbi:MULTISPECIES: acyl-CoA dehydrogenase family protein [Nocardia]|uniref:Acyl-CoA dehydrogenase family protein n=1 Tax=Nocardia implantans TaxID=3108168 RepID=A0ABU6APD6_9NOCA|nr:MULTISPECIES: acyl-CoA dehydrogenase family protein [unclassified Nocardia]MBF6189679.1 acyl-CoA dehydrogenase family protein [Nocardia beijingensis]MEA3527091.1 acyl-CoA dehydrogenase family protein [Nocardia sp. CDC192]MEB3509331.1 acyl-CoA dehydrogenase family protein [Nocardia sp. CDC186]